MKYTALLFCLAVTGAVAVNAASVSGQASIDKASAAIGGRIVFPRIPGINAPIANILGGIFGGPARRDHHHHRRPRPPFFPPAIPGLFPNGNRTSPVEPPNGNRTSPVDIPNGNRTTSNETTPNDSDNDSANDSDDDAANDSPNNSGNDSTNDSPNNDATNDSSNDSTNDSPNDATNDSPSGDDASNPSNESPSDDASNDSPSDDATNDATNDATSNDDATNPAPSALNRLANLFDIPDPDALIPDIPSGGNTSDIQVPAIPGLPDLSQLPRIPGLSSAIEMARDHVQEALGLGTDIAGGIQEAMQEAFDSEDPAAAIRTIVRTIIDAYLTVAANCPLMVVGSRVIQEGIRLALEVATSARNVIFGTTSAPPVL